MDSVAVIALVGVLGIGSQWLAWRFQIPSIVLMLLAGILAGPATGLINPAQDFGDMLRPVVAIAVAVILFEGGLTLDLKGLRDAGTPVKRLVFLGGPLAWVLNTLAGVYGAGLSWESAAVFGGILVVTGPTVIMPLLRQARLKARPASILRWEAIINDPVGALAAVLAFEVVLTLNSTTSVADAAMHLGLGITLACAVGYGAGVATVWAYARGHVPEYMKVPVLLGVLLAAYALTDGVLHESGLLAVTIMGVYIANAHLPSLGELRRFKEHMTVILVSGVFVLLAAGLDFELVAQLDWRAGLFVFLIVFIARPAAVLLSLIGTALPMKERLMVAWIGPRGIVAVAVSGLFGARLVELGVPDGALLPTLAFALVAVTVVAHGFSMVPLARLWDLSSAKAPGVLIVGASRWSVALSKTLQEASVPVLLTDRNWFKLRAARREGLPFYHGEILSETAEHYLDLNAYDYVITATDNDAYNALICTDFGPEFGRGNVFQIGRHEQREDDRDLPSGLGGRTLADGAQFEDYAERLAKGADFTLTPLTEEYTLETYLEDRPGAILLAVLEGGERLRLIGDTRNIKAKSGDSVLALVPPPESS